MKETEGEGRSSGYSSARLQAIHAELASRYRAPQPAVDIMLFGHGSYDPAGNLIKMPQNFQFYTPEDMALSATTAVAMASYQSHGVPITLQPYAEYLPNYQFGRIDQHDRLALAMQASLSASGRRKLRVCGQDEQFPNDSFMCGQDSHGCESGAHACSGLLGRFNGLTVAVIACRYDEVAYPGTATVPGRLLYHGEEEGYGPQHDGSAHAEELLGWCRAHQAHSLYYDQGEFATFFHKLTPATQALYLTVPSIYEWTLIRSLFLQSNHMTDAAGAVAHLATVRAQNPSDFRTLLRSADLRAALTPELYEAMAEAEFTLHPQEMYTASILAELWEVEDDGMRDYLEGRPNIRTWLVLRYAYSLSGGFTYSDDLFAYLRQSFALGDREILEILLSSEAPKNTLSLDQYYVGLMWYHLLGNDDAHLRATYQEAAEKEPKVREAVIADPDIYAKLVELGEIGAIPPGEESGYSPSDSDC